MVSQTKVLREESPTKEPVEEESRKLAGRLVNRSVGKGLNKGEGVTTNKEEGRYAYEV